MRARRARRRARHLRCPYGVNSAPLGEVGIQLERFRRFWSRRLGAPTQKIREGGRIINVRVPVATAANANGRRETPGLEVTSAEDGAG
ncbi:Transposase, Mutator family [Streptosporangium canum]|uniref:Transposase, Mutator family n=1 Tax=Streptosporangium canum TaxID=324952 RepID=A0A1I3YMX6_9ACTN|nr:Transposase, Mutator family [Streptosporangium canum]